MMKNKRDEELTKYSVNIKKLAMAGVMVALSVVCSAFYIPVGASKCFPVQHGVNVLSAVILGPFYGVGMAFCTSFIRVITGTGSLLAFPGSMAGALLCGMAYWKTKNMLLTFMCEAFGTGIIGGILAYPIATAIMNKEAAVFTYVIPFFISSAGGALIAVFIINLLIKTRVLETVKRSMC